MCNVVEVRWGGRSLWVPLPMTLGQLLEHVLPSPLGAADVIVMRDGRRLSDAESLIHPDGGPVVVRRRAHRGTEGAVAKLRRLLSSGRASAIERLAPRMLAKLLELPPLDPAPFGEAASAIARAASDAHHRTGARLPPELVRCVAFPIVKCITFDAESLCRIRSVDIHSVVVGIAEMSELLSMLDVIPGVSAPALAAMFSIRSAIDAGARCTSPALAPLRTRTATDALVSAASALFVLASRDGGGGTAARMLGAIIGASHDLGDASAFDGCKCSSCRSMRAAVAAAHIPLAQLPVVTVAMPSDRDSEDDDEDDEDDEDGEYDEGCIRVQIDRGDVLVTSFRSMFGLIGDRLDAWAESRSPRIDVRFAGESGYGEGVLRDWLSELLDGLFDPANGIFETASDRRIVHPSRGDDGEATMPSRLSALGVRAHWAWLAGLAVGFALRSRMPTGYHMSRALTKMVQGRPSTIGLAELEQLDPVVGMSARAALAAGTAEQLDALGLPGLTYGDRRLLPECCDDEPVTHDNRALLVQLIAARVAGVDGPAGTSGRAMRGGMLQAFGVSGGASLGAALLRSPNVASINVSIGGQLRLRASDIASRVQLVSGPCVDPRVARATLDALVCHVEHGMNDDARRRLLRFWTGSPGVSAWTATMPLQLVVTADDGGRRPHSHTCYNQLCVPAAADSATTLARLDDALASCDLRISDDP